MSQADELRLSEQQLDQFLRVVLERLGVPGETATLAARSLLDASLMGVDTHGVEALDMYVNHLRAGGLDPAPVPVILREKGSMGLWDMQSGFGLAGARRIMAHAIDRTKELGIYFATCRRTNHIGACGVYGLMAARRGLIAMICQGSRATFPPWGGTERRVGTSPMAFVAPVQGEFPFCYDASFGAITHAEIKAHMRRGIPLREGMALDSEGKPTTDPVKAWSGQVLPIGLYKGVGMAMWNEVLSCVLSGNWLPDQIPSIVNNPDRSADSCLYMMVMDPETLLAAGEFESRMRDYVEYVESSPARHRGAPPRYPGRRKGECWGERSQHGIPVSSEAVARFRKIAADCGVEPLC